MVTKNNLVIKYVNYFCWSTRKFTSHVLIWYPNFNSCACVVIWWQKHHLHIYHIPLHVNCYVFPSGHLTLVLLITLLLLWLIFSLVHRPLNSYSSPALTTCISMTHFLSHTQTVCAKTHANTHSYKYWLSSCTILSLVLLDLTSSKPIPW